MATSFRSGRARTPLYRHTQPSTYGRAFGAAAVTLLVVASVGAGFAPVPLFVAAFVGVWMWLTHELTVEVGTETVELRFGPGLISKTYQIPRIREARIVRNHWYYGWGIRKIPGGWLYNVAGLGGVELAVEPDRLVRIGTDEPERLLAAIEEARLYAADSGVRSEGS